ncbi:MAG: family transposase [Massilia sp.]|jgi:hypothetical protein|nr:family transposase [Massilia sp.]
MEAIRSDNFTPNEDVLAVALELSGKCWKVGLQDEKHERPAIYSLYDEQAAARLAHVVAVIEESKKKWNLPTTITVAVMYEAGQDGFWICRALSKLGYRAMVVDPASIPVERHARRVFESHKNRTLQPTRFFADVTRPAWPASTAPRRAQRGVAYQLDVLSSVSRARAALHHAVQVGNGGPARPRTAPARPRPRRISARRRSGATSLWSDARERKESGAPGVATESRAQGRRFNSRPKRGNP